MQRWWGNSIKAISGQWKLCCDSQKTVCKKGSSSDHHCRLLNTTEICSMLTLWSIKESCHCHLMCVIYLAGIQGSLSETALHLCSGTCSDFWLYAWITYSKLGRVALSKKQVSLIWVINCIAWPGPTQKLHSMALFTMTFDHCHRPYLSFMGGTETVKYLPLAPQNLYQIQPLLLTTNLNSNCTYLAPPLPRRFLRAPFVLCKYCMPFIITLSGPRLMTYMPVNQSTFRIYHLCILPGKMELDGLKCLRMHLIKSGRITFFAIEHISGYGWESTSMEHIWSYGWKPWTQTWSRCESQAGRQVAQKPYSMVKLVVTQMMKWKQRYQMICTAPSMAWIQDTICTNTMNIHSLI